MGKKYSIDKIMSKAQTDGCKAVILAEKNSMLHISEFVKYCERANIKPVIGAELNIEMCKIKGSVVLLAKDWIGYQEICRLFSDAHNTIDSENNPVISAESIYQILSERNSQSRHMIIIDKSNDGIIENGLLRNKMIEKEIRRLRKELKGLPSPNGESWKNAVGEANRLQEEDAITRKALKQVSVSDDYQIGFLKKKLKTIEAEKKKNRVIISRIERGISEREKISGLIEEKKALLNEDSQESVKKICGLLSAAGEVYIEISDPDKKKDLVDFAVNEKISLVYTKDIKNTDGVSYIPRQTDKDIEEIISRCNFTYQSVDWTVMNQDEKLREIINANIIFLKKKGKDWTEAHDIRMEEEIDKLRETKTEGYFLTVYDILKIVKLVGLDEEPGFDRDSSTYLWECNKNVDFYPCESFYPGLLISYILGITGNDPVEKELLCDISNNVYFRDGIRHPRFMIPSDISGAVYDRIKLQYGERAVSKIVSEENDDTSEYTNQDTIVIGVSDIRKYVPVFRNAENADWLAQCRRNDADHMGLFGIDLIKEDYLCVCRDCIQSVDKKIIWNDIPCDMETFEKIVSKGCLNFIYACEDMDVQNKIKQFHFRNMADFGSILPEGDWYKINENPLYEEYKGKEKYRKIGAFYRGILAYKMAYLKYHYPAFYITAYINRFPNKAKSAKYDPACKDVVFMNPDINLSKAESYIEHGNVRLGFKQIGSLRSISPVILKERVENGFFLSVEDFKRRLDLSEEAVEGLKDMGLFRNIGGPFAKNDTMGVESNQEKKEIQRPVFEEKEDQAILEGILLKVEEKVSKDGNMMATVRIGTSTGEFNAVFFSKSYEAYSSLLKVDTEIRLYGKYIYDKYGMTFSVKEAYPISDDTYYILSQDYKEELFVPFRRKCGCQLYLMNGTGKLVNTEAYYSSEISSICGVRVIPKI